jgi:hypothetical protein
VILPAGDPFPLNRTDHYRYILGYEDATIRPDNNMTRDEVAAVFFRLLTQEARRENRQSYSGFPDVAPDHWAAESVGTMRRAGVITGDPDGSFRPAGSITRGEFAAIAARFDPEFGSVPHAFTDLSGHWAERYVAAAAQKGWILGYPDGTFRPDQPITRAEAVTLINRMLTRRVDAAGVLPELVPDYRDVAPDHWAYYDLLEATVSHTWLRAGASGPLERWTGRGADLNFDAD